MLAKRIACTRINFAKGRYEYECGVKPDSSPQLAGKHKAPAGPRQVVLRSAIGLAVAGCTVQTRPIPPFGFEAIAVQAAPGSSDQARRHRLQEAKMPLLKRKPHLLLPTPDSIKPSEEVWLLELTGEVFRDYEAYLTRLHAYRAKQWQCK